MTVEEYNAYCSSLPATSYVMQWGGAHVWKVGGQANGQNKGQSKGQSKGKVFAICGWATGQAAISFKVSQIGFEMMKDMPGLRPAPYLASRGFTWIQHHGQPGLSQEELKASLAQSHHIVAQGLSAKLRRELGLDA